jgi:hypothetical protein
VAELRRRAGAGRLRRELARLSAETVAREAGVRSIGELWHRQWPSPMRPSPAERAEVRHLYEGPFAGEGRALRARVERILAHEFDLLGSGPVRLGPELDWHRDFKSGRRWDLLPSETIDYAELDRDSDVKIPWELSRSQHLTALARAWIVDGDTRCPQEFERQIRSWISANPVGLGVNWACTMDVALRAVSWIWALGLFEDAPFSDGFVEEVLLSLYRHGLWIPEHLEEGEINGNHYVSDALGMVACGAVFRDTPRGRGWLAKGAQLLEREITKQVEEDGVDIEGSVAYHRLVLEIFLVGARFLEMAGAPVSEAYRRRLAGMLDFVEAYVTPEGLAPMIGDADDGRALVLGETDLRDHRYLLSTGCAWLGSGAWKRRAGRFWEDSLWLLGPSALARFEALEAAPSSGSRAFPVAGFFVFRSPRQYLFVDAGPVGFRGRGGHGHNDCLSFEWHADGRPVLTDSGAYVYTASPEWRNKFRSTEFHNTIRVDGEEINRFPSALSLWSLRDDARPMGVRFVSGPTEDRLDTAHTGYRRLADPVTVSRSLVFDRLRPVVRIEDRLDGSGEHLVEFFFHAHSGARSEILSEMVAVFRWPDGFAVRIDHESGPPVTWVERAGWFSPSYGVKMPRPILVASVRARLALAIVWRLAAGE